MNNSSIKKKNKQNNKDYGKITQSMINKENKELDRVTNFLLDSLNRKDFPKDFRKKILQNKLKKICENIKKKNNALLPTKSSNKIGGGGDEDIRDITNEARNIVNNQLVPRITNNDTVQNELPVVTQNQAEHFISTIPNNNIIVRQGNRTLNHTNLNVSGQVTDLGVLALQSPDENIRLRAFEALVGTRENDNARQRERRYLANTVFLITFIGGIVMTYQVWRVFSVITNVTGDINDATAPAPAPTPGWGDYVSGIFSGPTPAPAEPEPPRQQSWWEWMGSGGRFGLNRLFYVMHIITSFLHELIFVSQIGATMATFIFTTFIAIALWHVMDGGFSITTFGFSFSTGRQPHRLQGQQPPMLANQGQQPHMLTNQGQQPHMLTNQGQQQQQQHRLLMNSRQQQQQQRQQQQQQQSERPMLMNDSSTQSPQDKTGGKKRRRKRKTHKKKSKKRRKTYKKKNKRKTKKNKKKSKRRRRRKRKRTKKGNKK